MKSRLTRTFAVVTLFLACSGSGHWPVLAQEGASAARPSTSRTAAIARTSPAGHGPARVVSTSRASAIRGAAWRSDNTPVGDARLRLRNVITGNVQGTTVSDEDGTFGFNAVPPGTYLIEMVTESGRIVMVGQTFTVAPGTTVATFLRLGPTVPWFAGFFNNAASIIAAAAASTGVTAIAPEAVPPVSAAR